MVQWTAGPLGLSDRWALDYTVSHLSSNGEIEVQVQTRSFPKHLTYYCATFLCHTL